MLMDQFGGQIVVRRNVGTANESSATLRGMKNNEKNNRNKIMFQFPDPADVRVGDILQQQNSRDLWEVYEVEDIVMSGTFINLNAWVHKKEGTLGRQFAADPSIVIAGDNLGGIRIAGSKSNQSMNVTASAIRGEIAALRKVADEARDIEALDKEEMNLALDRIEELSMRKQSAGIVQRIKAKLDFVKVAMDVSERAAVAAPYIAAILEKLT